MLSARRGGRKQIPSLQEKTFAQVNRPISNPGVGFDRTGFFEASEEQNTILVGRRTGIESKFTS